LRNVTARVRISGFHRGAERTCPPRTKAVTNKNLTAGPSRVSAQIGCLKQALPSSCAALLNVPTGCAGVQVYDLAGSTTEAESPDYVS